MKATKERRVFEKITNVIHLELENSYIFDVGKVTYILDYKDNKLSNNLKSWDRWNGYILCDFKEKKVNRGWTDKHGGYYLSFSINSVTIRIHRLVAFLMFGFDLFGKEVNHISGNREDNTVNNIELCTRAENAKNAKDRGAFDGVGAWKGVIKENDIEKIKTMKNNGMLNKEIAKIYGIDQSNISKIMNNKWGSRVENKDS